MAVQPAEPKLKLCFRKLFSPFWQFAVLRWTAWEGEVSWITWLLSYAPGRSKIPCLHEVHRVKHFSWFLWILPYFPTPTFPTESQLVRIIYLECHNFTFGIVVLSMLWLRKPKAELCQRRCTTIRCQIPGIQWHFLTSENTLLWKWNTR